MVKRAKMALLDPFSQPILAGFNLVSPGVASRRSPKEGSKRVILTLFGTPFGQ